jgi:hypothetical protein
MTTFQQVEWLRNSYKINLNILINHKRAGFRSDWWVVDFKSTWQKYKITQRLYAKLKRGVKVVDAITFEEGQG